MNHNNKSGTKSKEKKGIKINQKKAFYKGNYKIKYFNMKDKHNKLISDINKIIMQGRDDIVYNTNDHKSFSCLLYDLEEMLEEYNYKGKKSNINNLEALVEPYIYKSSENNDMNIKD